MDIDNNNHAKGVLRDLQSTIPLFWTPVIPGIDGIDVRGYFVLFRSLNE